MKHYAINIGLRNNRYDTYELATEMLVAIHDAVANVLGLDQCKVISSEHGVGDWDESPEPTAVILIESAMSLELMKKTIVSLCSEMTQECIPFLCIDNALSSDPVYRYDELVYNRTYDGEKYEFNFTYFIMPSSVGNRGILNFNGYDRKFNLQK